ncbi:MAG: hypothetical protein IKM88_10315 [Lachnospiraceae bacterium]|nr:hypothetical protein [Lachnospiraceae bacterium]
MEGAPGKDVDMKLQYKGGINDWTQDRVFLLNLFMVFIDAIGFYISLLMIDIVLSLFIWTAVAAAFWMGTGYIARRSVVTIKASDSAVAFKTLHKKIVAPYSDIKSIKLTRELARGRRISYVETISIRMEDGRDFWLSKPMDDIDLAKIAERPEELKERFDNSPFNELKTYIESRMPIC